MAIEIPPDADHCDVKCGRKKVTLTNLHKIFWPQLGKTKRDLLLYYDAMSPVLIPHLKDRAMVMKRYPNGIEGEFFFMKRTPAHHPEWLRTCSIEHRSGNVIDFPIADDGAALLWIVNLGCIDLNQCTRAVTTSTDRIMFISIWIPCRRQDLPKCSRLRFWLEISWMSEV
jgi:bifunctional non-homologous end joining protein LigD